MYLILLTIFILVSLVLVIVVLMQSSKGGGLAGAFGGSSDAALLGGRSAGNFLSRMTWYLAFSFIGLSLILSILSARTTEPTEGIVAKQQKSGAINNFEVEEGASILDELDTVAPQEEASPPAGGASETESE
ncbi:MAG: preprotein translocase subunit SecG [Candidatus Krumholzibacteria bacterium]|jgi:preprotein translocase subunit SecG|nr:preprotein translocase subunit SecG [Candidatus Krumholzibacteria bacterium]MDP6669265.1 preprotein translocase subunit SecG [Candidatus Krumholzibacteria bacterium]MDP6796347.1 preprotein translocase subunit SecG [Candidatus Krumholzibacteria bacterium]MDP7021153.1 preprotein translocase subunit SecG [Candidatus Krumholzibacteria bacterium]